MKALFKEQAKLARDHRRHWKEEMAELSQVDYSTVTKWMNGSVRPTPERHSAIAAATGRAVQEVEAACAAIPIDADRVEALERRVDQLSKLVEFLMKDVDDADLALLVLDATQSDPSTA